MANGTITIRTTPQLEERINALAKAMDRSRNWVIEDALQKYVESQDWQVEGIKEAQKSLEQGEGIPFDDVMDRLQSKIENSQK